MWISIFNVLFYFIYSMISVNMKKKAACSSIKPGDRQKKSLLSYTVVILLEELR